VKFEFVVSVARFWSNNAVAASVIVPDINFFSKTGNQGTAYPKGYLFLPE